jgi:hypothetical protein
MSSHDANPNYNNGIKSATQIPQELALQFPPRKLEVNFIKY